MNGATNARNTVIRRLTMAVGANNGETADTPEININLIMRETYIEDLT